MTLVVSYGLLVTFWVIALFLLGFWFPKTSPDGPPIVVEVFWAGLIVWATYSVLKMPIEITMRPDSTLEFRGPLGRRVVGIQDIRSIKGSPVGGAYLEIKYQDGKITMFRDIHGLYELLHKMKSSNPAIVIKGC